MTLQHALDLIGYCFIPMILIDCYVALFVPPSTFKSWWACLYNPIFAIWMFFVGVDAFRRGRHVAAVVFVGLSAAILYYWWTDEDRRNKRRKMLEKGWGRVVDLGGRLKVVQPQSQS